jgi:Leucine-rich repeat (LRR) protein
MNKLRTVILGALIVSSQACEKTKTADLKKFKDVKQAVLRDDGLYNVICLDGTVETGITLQQLERDDVCNQGSTDDPRLEFTRSCRAPNSKSLAATYDVLKQIAGKTDCLETYDVLRSRDTLIIFAYPSTNPDKLTTIEPLKYFSHLKKLGVFSQKISDLSPLSGLTNLEDLALSYNQIYDVSPLQSLRNLQYLDLSHNRIRDFTPVENLPHMKKLTRTGNP